MKAIWKVARGRANSIDTAFALKAVQNGGIVIGQILRETANVVDKYGYRNVAVRLQSLRNQVRDLSLGQMV
jgi:hypothetical protein